METSLNLIIGTFRPVLRTALSFLVLIVGITVAPQLSYAAPAALVAPGDRAVIVNTDGDPIRIREGAGTEYKQIGQMHEGETLLILAGPSKDSSGRPWYMVEAQSVNGWMLAEFLAPSGRSASEPQPSKAQPPKLSGNARVANTNGDPLRMRSAPSRGGAVVAMVPPGTTVIVRDGPATDAEGISWYQISAFGSTGYAMAQYLVQADQPAQTGAATDAGSSTGEAPAETASSGKDALIVSNALKYVGYPYRFGGASPSGFDCSGFIYYALKQSGVPVGRDMYSQLNSGPRVGSKELRPGDLVFFANTYKRGLSHAGIYIGNGKFVHAENEGTDVSVSSLWSSYYASRYYAAVRPY